MPAQPSPDRNPVDPALSAHAALQAPWRLDYLMGVADEDRRSESPTPHLSRVSQPVAAPPQGGSFIGAYWADPSRDEANHVVARTSHGMIFLNAYPYSNGHLLVALGAARGRLLDYAPEDRARLWALTDAAVDLAEIALQPQGVNVGVNQGRAAGAGVPQHLHVHVVPRWGGDTNFITTVGRVRVIPASLDVMAARFRATWAKISAAWTDILAR